MFEAVLEEARLVADGGMTISAYKQLRPRLIFVEEYMWTWLLSERLDFTSEGLEHTTRLRYLASELVYLTNDLGSAEKDRIVGADPNLVVLIEREQQKSEHAAVADVIQLHNDTVAEYRAELELLRGRHWSTPVRGIAWVMEFTVRGNLHTTRRLSATRYPGSKAALDQLSAYPELPGE
jgi:hypothetical protein